MNGNAKSTDGPDGGSDCSDDAARIALTVKDTRRGKLLVYADEAAKDGIRSMTDAEFKANDYLGEIVERFDTEPFDHNEKVGYVHVPRYGDPCVEWCSDEARSAAGGAT